VNQDEQKEQHYYNKTFSSVIKIKNDKAEISCYIFLIQKLILLCHVIRIVRTDSPPSPVGTTYNSPAIHCRVRSLSSLRGWIKRGNFHPPAMNCRAIIGCPCGTRIFRRNFAEFR